jgi:hypothetical protein
MRGTKQALYRKVNTTAHGVYHRTGGDFSVSRPRVKAGEEPDRRALAMHPVHRRGLDYTPLFRFLLSRVGKPWREVHREAVSRLDREEPIFWMVAVDGAEAHDYIRTGESSFFSGLRVDDEGILRLVDPSIGPGSLTPSCACCTHTFNGKPFLRKFVLESAS